MNNQWVRSALSCMTQPLSSAAARKWHAQPRPIILCWQVQEIEATVDPETVTFEQIEGNIVRCPDAAVAEEMIARVDEIRKQV